MERVAKRRDAALTAAADLAEVDDAFTPAGHAHATRRLAHAAAASVKTVKAQEVALEAAEKLRRSLQNSKKAAAAAEKEHRRFRTCRDELQKEAACLECMAVQFAHVEPIISNGLKAYHDPPFVGDFDRFFVRLFVDPTPGGYITCLPKVNDQDTIASVKAKIQDKEGIPAERLKLMYAGQKLRDEQTLSSYGIIDNDTDWTIYGVLLPMRVPSLTL
jgi:hypothetical protein